jgi:hypothetical protein
VSAIPLADAPAFTPYARVTRAVLTVLAAAAIGATIAFLLLSRSVQSQTLVPLPNRADTIVVLDVSASISADTYSRIGAVLASLARSRGRLGLVVFSDAAYEALPPGTPAADLGPLVRYFTLPPQSRVGFAPTFPPNPWLGTFTAGTRISAGLALAHDIAVAGTHRPVVVLVSDLDDNPGDVTRLTTVLLAYERDRLPIRVVGLNPAPDKLAFFQHLIGTQSGPIVQAPLLKQSALPHGGSPFPSLLVALAAAAAGVLAVHALWAPRLTWRRA